MTVYAIPNCNTVKKALDFLKSKQVSYEFHDYKKKGISIEKLTQWCETFGWEKIVNKNGMTWKKQEESIKSSINDIPTAVAFLQKNTSAIKRPIIEFDQKTIIGFDENTYLATF